MYIHDTGKLLKFRNDYTRMNERMYPRSQKSRRFHTWMDFRYYRCSRPTYNREHERAFGENDGSRLTVPCGHKGYSPGWRDTVLLYFEEWIGTFVRFGRRDSFCADHIGYQNTYLPSWPWFTQTFTSFSIDKNYFNELIKMTSIKIKKCERLN